MTGKVLSLSCARKTRARAKARRQADANATKYGRSKAQRVADDKARAKADQALDGHKLDDDSQNDA